MQLIVDVLEHPKHPPNWLATGVSLVSALILFAKSSRDFWASAVVLHAPDIISLIGLIAGMSASLVIIWSAVDQQIKYSRDVHRKRAIEYAKMEAVG
jgi:heme exporter protein D